MKDDCNNADRVKQVNKSNQRINTYAIVLCALFTGLIAVGAFFKIPFQPVPVTLQVTFVLSAGMMLGSKMAAVSAFVYLIIGLIGVPVFALGGGLAYLLQPTFGYILGFVPGAYITGRIVEKLERAGYKSYFGASLAGLLVVYFVGIVYFYFLSRFYLNREVGLWYLLANGLLLSLPGDVLFCAVGAMLAKRMKPITAVYFNSEYKSKNCKNGARGNSSG